MTLIDSIIIARLRHYETVAPGVELTVYGLSYATGIPEADLQPALNRLVDTGMLLWRFTGQWAYRLNPNA
jgi:hypothetical protein